MVLVYHQKKRRNPFGNLESSVLFDQPQFSWTFNGKRRTYQNLSVGDDENQKAEDGNSDIISSFPQSFQKVFSRWLPSRKGHLECNEMKSVEISSVE